MAFGISGVFGKKKSKSSTEQSRSATTTTEGQKTATTTGQQAQTVQTLDADTQDLLRQLIGQSASAQTEQGDLIGLLSQRAGGADAAFDPTPIVDEARRVGERDLTRAVTGLAASTGSSQNSLVQALGLEARGDLETQLGALASQLQIQGRQAATGEIATAAGAGQNQLVQLLELLKGAETTGQTDSSQRVEELLSSQETLSELLKGFTKGKESGFSLGGSFGI